VTGFSASRELPIIWRIALGSLRNKIILLMPALLLLQAVLPGAITPLLMLGGCYLCFEGAEKLFHSFLPHADEGVEADFHTGDTAALEEERVAGAIKTDFILSAEIMTIALSVVHEPTLFMQAGTLALVAVSITAGVYGAVALIVKMDDIGLHMSKHALTGFGRALGRLLVKGMPWVMRVLSTVGTAAMLWVGGNIVLHGLAQIGIWSAPYDAIHHVAATAAAAMPQWIAGFTEWLVTAAFDGVAGLAIGLLLIPVATRVIGPLWARLTGAKPAGH
jgi:predicted DNA repair protein MutK